MAGRKVFLTRKDPLCQFVQHGPALAAGPVGQGPVQGVSHGLDALFGQRLKAHGQIRPTQQAACGKGDFNTVAQIGLGRLAHEELAHLIGVIHHRFAQILRQSREALAEQLFFHRRVGIADFTENEAVGKGQILALGALVQACFIAAAVSVGRGRETEQRMRRDQFTAVLRNAKR